MVAFDQLPPCFLFLLRPFLPTSIPRCISKIRCINKNLSEYFAPDVTRWVERRMFDEKLHIHTRTGCILAYSKFILAKKTLCPEYSLQDIKGVFRSLFEHHDVNMRKKGMEMIFRISTKYSYGLIINEFLRSSNKKIFCYLIRDPNLSKIDVQGQRRVATRCAMITMMLLHGDNLAVALALCILRSYVSFWSEPVQKLVSRLQNSEDTDVQIQAEQCLAARAAYEREYASTYEREYLAALRE